MKEFFLTVNPAVWCSVPDAAEIELVAGASEPVLMPDEAPSEPFFIPGGSNVYASESLLFCRELLCSIVL